MQDSNSQQWVIYYSVAPRPSELVNKVFLGKIHNAVESRILPLFELRKCTASDDIPVTSMAAPQMQTNGSVVYKQVEKSATLSKPHHFIDCLKLLMNSFAFVCVTIAAKFPDWSGNEKCGCVRGNRLMFTSEDASYYIGYWTPLAHCGFSVTQLVWLEAKCRKFWAGPFSDGVRLGCAMRLAVDKISGVVEAAKFNLHSTPRTILKDKRKAPGDDGVKGSETKSSFDIAKAAKGYRENRTGSELPGGKKICKFWTDGRVCKFGDSCKMEHRCDWMIDDGNGGTKICGLPHKRIDHPW